MKDWKLRSGGDKSFLQPKLDKLPGNIVVVKNRSIHCGIRDEMRTREVENLRWRVHGRKTRLKYFSSLSHEQEPSICGLVSRGTERDGKRHGLRPTTTFQTRSGT